MSSEPPPIVDFASVVQPHLADDGLQLLSYKSRYLTKPGDNYGSIMLAITAQVRCADGSEDQLPLVAKLPPVTNDFYWQMFQPERTCITENAMYQNVAPQLRQLQLDAGVPQDELFDGLPRYYGSRISLDAAATRVDRDAVLVQENLQVSGYRAGNRHQMYDDKHARLVLEYMAQYHALPVALRLKKPAVYEEYVRPYFHRFNMNTGMGNGVQDALKQETMKEIAQATNNNGRTAERIKELWNMYDRFLELPNAADGPFTTLVHCDMWINNLMVKYDAAGVPCKVKFVDFQIGYYESLVHDIIFFLLSSVDSAVLEQHYDDYLALYYETFVRCLQRVGVPTDAYSYELFLAEVRNVAHLEVPHALFMTKIILADNSTMPEDFKDMDFSIIGKNSGVAAIIQKTAEIIQLAEKFKFL